MILLLIPETRCTSEPPGTHRKTQPWKVVLHFMGSNHETEVVPFFSWAENTSVHGRGHCLGEMRVLNDPEKPCFAGFCFPMTWQTVTNVLWGRTMRINVVCQFVSLKDRHKIDRQPTSFSKPKMATKCEVDYLGKWKIEPDLWWLLWSRNPRCLKFRTCRCNSWKALSCLWMTPAIYLFEIK